MSNRQNQNEIPWIAVILCFMFFWPVGLLLLIRKLSTPSSQRKAADRANGTYAGVQQPDAPRKNPKKSYRTMTVIGGILLGIAGLSLIGGFSDVLYWIGTEWFWEELWSLVSTLAMFGGGGAALLALSGNLRRRDRRIQRYRAYIGTSKIVSLGEMASAVGVKYNKLLKDLEYMLDQGELPGAYLDYATGELVLPGAVRENDGRKREKPQAEARNKTQAAEKPEKNEYEAIIQEIVELNRDIDDEEVSKKIDRIEYVTRKIFRYVQERPEKKPQLDKFMNYYLPNTLKMLRAYAQFEEQRVSGKNIGTAMKEIEEIMDKLVAGFEKQLDRLFEDDAVDISTDITVLEGMLAKDGFTGDSDFQLKL